MRIIRVHLKHFGKFEDTRLNFTPGVNIICGGNETGKTTIHAFIRAMFFGLDRARGRAGSPGEYQKRQPWENGAYFAGAMWVEDAGKTWRIERNFSRNGKSLRVIDESEGLEMANPEGALRKMLQGCDEAAFESTVFIPQADASSDEKMYRSLRTVMMSVRDGGDGIVDVQAALESLRKKKKQIQAKKEQEYELLEEKIVRKKMEEELLSKDLEALKKEAQTQEDRAGLPGFSDPALREESPAEEAGRKKESADLPGQQEEDLEERKLYRLLQVCIVAVAVLCFGCMLVLQDTTRKVLAGAACGLFLIIWALLHLRMIPGGNRKDGSGTDRPLTDSSGQAQDLENQEKNGSGIAEHSSDEVSYHSGAAAARAKQIQDRAQSLRQADALLQELYRKVDALGQYDIQVKALDLAMARIEELSYGMSRDNGKDCLARAGRILSGITGGQYDAVSVDEKGRVRLNTPDRLLDLSQVSFGTMQQVYLALRLALAQQAGLSGMPLLLDETFAMYDDERLKNAMRWLYSSKRQVILFSCQTREKRILDQIREE